LGGQLSWSHQLLKDGYKVINVVCNTGHLSFREFTYVNDYEKAQFANNYMY